MDHISSLRPDPRNARKRTERSAGMIAKSLEKFGAARSIVIDETGQILAGHGTIEAAAQVGIENLLVVPADGNTIVAVQRSDLTPEQKAQYAIADNRASDLSDWDADVLQALAAEHDLSDWWSADELAELADADPGPAGPEDDESLSITITLDETELLLWQQAKDQLGLTRDKTAFLRIVEHFLAQRDDAGSESER